MKRLLSIIFIICLLFSVDFTLVNAEVSVSIETTLKSNAVIKSSKKTFDVIARKNGKKIDSSVTLNGNKVSKAWNDSDKTSFTLNLTKEGSNTVEITADGVSKRINITYIKAKPGEVIGQASVSVELFSFGNGYLIEPINIDIIEGENAATALVKFLHKNGYLCYYSGEINKSFYMAYIADGDKSEKNYSGYKSSFKDYGKPSNPRKIKIKSNIPKMLCNYLENDMNYFEKDDYKNANGFLGEFLFTNGSGWMYSVNNVFPNVSFSQTYLSDGDVMRVQFTMGYGADIGGFSAMGGSVPGADGVSGDYYKVSDKSNLTLFMAYVNSKGLKSKLDIKSAYENCYKVAEELDASQSKVDNATKHLSETLSKYVDVKDIVLNENSNYSSNNSKNSKENSVVSKNKNKRVNNSKNLKQEKTTNKSSNNKQDSNNFSKEQTTTNKNKSLKQSINSSDNTNALETEKNTLNNKNNKNAAYDNTETLAVILTAVIIILAVVAIILLILLLIYILKKKGIIKNDK